MQAQDDREVRERSGSFQELHRVRGLLGGRRGWTAVRLGANTHGMKGDFNAVKYELKSNVGTRGGLASDESHHPSQQLASPVPNVRFSSNHA